MVKKVILSICVIFIVWLLAVLLHNFGVDFYKKYYFFKRDLSFGIFIHLVFEFLFPVSLVISTILFFHKRKLKIVPYLLLIFYILFDGFWYRPYRTTLVLFCVSCGHFLLWFILKQCYKITK